MDLKDNELAHDIQEIESTGKTPVKNHCAKNLLKPGEQKFLQITPQKNFDLLQVPGVANNDITPTKFTAVPQSSPVDKNQEPINSRLSDSFKTEEFRALLVQLSTEKNLQEITEDSSELPTIHIASDNSVSDYPTGTYQFQAYEDLLFANSEEIANGNRNVFPELKYFQTNGSLSGISLDVVYGSSFNDDSSLLAQRSSEASDISNETDGSLTEEEDFTFQMEKQDTKESLSTCQLKAASPKKPLSAMGKFLNKRKNLTKRDRFSSLNTIGSSLYVNDSCESELLQTI